VRFGVQVRAENGFCHRHADILKNAGQVAAFVLHTFIFIGDLFQQNAQADERSFGVAGVEELNSRLEHFIQFFDIGGFSFPVKIIIILVLALSQDVAHMLAISLFRNLRLVFLFGVSRFGLHADLDPRPSLRSRGYQASTLVFEIISTCLLENNFR
jgi:hypothetical protein